MFQQLKMALRKQRRMLLTFLLTIFLPAVALSVFGLIALRNERYRLERQFREEQLTLIDSIKSQVDQQIRLLERELLSIARTASFENRSYDEMLVLVEQYRRNHPISDQFFVVYEGSEPWFPPFTGNGSGYIPSPAREFSESTQSILDEAENLEFIQKDFSGALVLLRELQKTVVEPDLQARVLNLMGRNLLKQGELDQAIEVYNRIIDDFPHTQTSSGTLLPVTVRFQLADCYLESHLPEKAVEAILEAYKAINNDYKLLSEDQLSAYASLAQEEFNAILQENPARFSEDSTSIMVFENLNNQYSQHIRRWQLINNLRDECIPEIADILNRSSAYFEGAYQYLNRFGNDDFLILTCQIMDPTANRLAGIAGIKLNNLFLENNILTEILGHFDPDLHGALHVTNLSGRTIYGKEITESDALGVSSFFEDNFPPWQIEVSGHQSAPFFRKGILQSYYFWTILAMVMILVFGVAITGRIIAHEKEVLKIKSDFVSSVSHEFKTPITSITALTERLLEGNVKDPARIKEYYTRIAQDAGNLGHLVGNILDFSKMEEGRKVYNFEETDLEEWLKKTVADFFSNHPERRYKFRVLSCESPVPLQMDRSAFLLAVHNLLDNAIKFSSERSEISVILEQHTGQCRLDIHDEGVGIPQEEQSRIFEKFYRGNHALKYAATGTGLGLAIVWQIIDAHGGTVQVESSPGNGSTFKVILPCKNPTSL